MRYDPSTVEPRWQARWEEDKIDAAPDVSDRPKYYILDMFPYPSGAGLHVGHPEGYTATDITGPLPSACRASTCCTPWASTPSACPRRTTPSRPASTRPRSTDAEHRQHPQADQVAGLLLRLGPGGLHHRPGLLQVDPVDLPQALRAGPGLRGGGAHQLVPLLQDRPGQRGGQGRPLRPLLQRGDPPGSAAVDAEDHRLRRAAAGGAWTIWTGPSRSRRCSRTGSAAPRAPTWTFTLADPPPA